MSRRRPLWRDRRLLWALAGTVALAWSAVQAGAFAGDLFNPGGWTQVREFFAAAARPQLTGDFLARTARAAFVTLAFAAFGTFLSLILGTVGGVLASEAWWEAVSGGSSGKGLGRARLPWLGVRGLLAVPRAIHEILWGLFFINLIGLDPLVGVLAIAIPYGAITAKIFSEILDESSHDAMDALLNRGVGAPKAFLYGLLPEAFRDLLSYAFYRFECSIRSAAVLGIIGAGGLGYELFLSFQSLRYEQMWTLLGALILLTGATDFWSGFLRRRLGAPHRIRLDAVAGGAVRPEAPASDSAPRVYAGSASEGSPADRPSPTRPRRDPVVRRSLVLALVILAASAWYVGPHFGQLFGEGPARMLARLAGEAFPPGLGGLAPGELLELSAGTLAMSILAIAGAAAGGLLFSFPGATNLLLPGGLLLGERSRTGWKVAGTALFVLARGLLLVLRAVPAPIWALLFLFVFFPGVVPGALALGLYTMGVLGRLMAEVVENLDEGPLEALKAQGASGLQVFLYGVLPATVPQFVSYVLYRWEVSIRGTVMVGIVGAGSLGVLLTEQLSSFDYSAVLTTLGCYVLLTFLVDMVSALARGDLR